MYINNKLSFSDNAYAHFNTSTIDLEAQWVSITQQPNKTILYRPPQGNVSNCIDFLVDVLIKNIDLHKTEVFLIGDLNLDILDKDNFSAKQIINTMKQLRLCLFIKEPTRYSRNKDSCIDLIITNSDIIAKSGVF